MNWLKRINPFRKGSHRTFKAAQINRLVADWVNQNVKTNDDIKRSLPALVARSRDLAKNNSEYRKYLAMRERNIIGDSGINLQIKSLNADGTLDRYANKMLEFHFARWGKKRNGYCHIDGRLSWHGVQILVSRTLAIDGECFIRKVRKPSGGNPYLFTLQILNTTLCDITLNKVLRNGNRIIMGIELDSSDRVVAYHFRVGEKYSNKLVRLPADEIIHIYRQEFVGQVRGFPRACAAILDINMLGGYKEAELVAARVSSAKMGFLIPEKGKSGLYQADEEEDYLPLNEVSPGTIELLPPGYKFEKFDPQNNGANFSSFFKAIMRSIASGLGVSYNDFANDLEGVNFSSMRAGTLSERDGWKLEQREFIESFCEIVYQDWLKMFLMSGLTNLPFSKLAKFEADVWIGRRWPWVDPLKDAKFAELMINNNLKSPQEVIRETGRDPEDVLLEIEEWNKSLKKRGLLIEEEVVDV